MLSATQGDQIGRFFAIGLLLRFLKWFVVDALSFHIELCCRYFWPFLTWQLFGLFFEKFGYLFSNLLVTLLPQLICLERQ
jgi:hypothetical protein